MAKNGIKLPPRTPGQGRGLLGGVAPQLPAGVTRSQYEAAVKKCGGNLGLRRGLGGARFSSPAIKQALVAFVTCMRAKGINLPPPNTSGKGPIFNSAGINTQSTQFRAAVSACQASLRAALPARPGAAPGAPGAGAPGAGTTG